MGDVTCEWGLHRSPGSTFAQRWMQLSKWPSLRSHQDIKWSPLMSMPSFWAIELEEISNLCRTELLCWGYPASITKSWLCLFTTLPAACPFGLDKMLVEHLPCQALFRAWGGGWEDSTHSLEEMKLSRYANKWDKTEMMISERWGMVCSGDGTMLDKLPSKERPDWSKTLIVNGGKEKRDCEMILKNSSTSRGKDTWKPRVYTQPGEWMQLRERWKRRGCGQRWHHRSGRELELCPAH